VGKVIWAEIFSCEEANELGNLGERGDDDISEVRGAKGLYPHSI